MLSLLKVQPTGKNEHRFLQAFCALAAWRGKNLTQRRKGTEVKVH